MSRLVYGKDIASHILNDIKNSLKNYLLKIPDSPPKLAVLLVGNDPSSIIYVEHKRRTLESCGLPAHDPISMSSSSNLNDILNEIDRLNEDSSVHGILVQLPLPKNIDVSIVLNRIKPEKDVDGLSWVNGGRLLYGGGSGLPKPIMIPCAPLACMSMIRHCFKNENMNGKLIDKKVLIINRSALLGRPLASLLLQEEGCSVQCASYNKPKLENLEYLVKNADIVISATGSPGLINREWLKKSSLMLDIGAKRLENGSVLGDLSTTGKSKANIIVPSKGGIGPLTIAHLVRNTFRAACFQKGVPLPKSMQSAIY